LTIKDLMAGMEDLGCQLLVVVAAAVRRPQDPIRRLLEMVETVVLVVQHP
jgi:hypothetical protein